MLPADSAALGDAVATHEAPHPESWTRRSEATGGWGGIRPQLAEAGVTIGASWVYDVSSNVRGGLRRGTAARGLLDAGLTADLGTLFGLKGGTVFVGMHTHGGPDGSQLSGDLQAFSNVDAEPFAGLAEAWYEQSFLGGGVRTKVGQVDANSEFAVTESAGEFINASAGFSPTIYALPTYPDPVPSANLFLRPAAWFSLGGGVYRSTLLRTPAGSKGSALFAVVEAAGNWNGGRLAVGYWSHPGGYAPRFEGGTVRAPAGYYVSVEQRLLSGEDRPDGPPSATSLFLKYGRADEAVSDFGQHFMLGLVREGPFGWRKMAVGVSATHADLSDVGAAGYDRNETSVEAFVRIPLLGFLTLRPDAQYIVHPGGAGGVGDALVGTLRSEITF